MFLTTSDGCCYKGPNQTASTCCWFQTHTGRKFCNFPTRLNDEFDYSTSFPTTVFPTCFDWPVQTEASKKLSKMSSKRCQNIYLATEEKTRETWKEQLISTTKQSRDGMLFLLPVSWPEMSVISLCEQNPMKETFGRMDK